MLYCSFWILCCVLVYGCYVAFAAFCFAVLCCVVIYGCCVVFQYMNAVLCLLRCIIWMLCCVGVVVWVLNCVV